MTGAVLSKGTERESGGAHWEPAGHDLHLGSPLQPSLGSTESPTSPLWEGGGDRQLSGGRGRVNIIMKHHPHPFQKDSIYTDKPP